MSGWKMEMKAVLAQYKVYEDLQKKAMKMKITCSLNLWSLPPPYCITSSHHPENFQLGCRSSAHQHNIFMLINYGIKFYNFHLSLVTLIQFFTYRLNFVHHIFTVHGIFRECNPVKGKGLLYNITWYYLMV
jgi:hypothetical protein